MDVRNEPFDWTVTYSGATSASGIWWRVTAPSWTSFANLFAKMGEKPIPLTQSDYHRLKSANRRRYAALKASHGAFTPFVFSGNRRRQSNVIGYSPILTLDFDGTDGKGLTDEEWQRLTCRARRLALSLCYETASSAPGARKCRMVFRLDRAPAGANEWKAAERCLGATLTRSRDMPGLDPASFRIPQMMYFPMGFSDRPTIVQASESQRPLPLDRMLAYWKADPDDPATWPRSEAERRFRENAADSDSPFRPRSFPADGKLPGSPKSRLVVEAFNASHSVYEAIRKWLGSQYEPFGRNRFSLISGSEPGGLVVFEDGDGSQHAFSFDASMESIYGGRPLKPFQIMMLGTQGIIERDGPAFDAALAEAMADPDTRNTLRIWGSRPRSRPRQDRMQPAGNKKEREM